MWRFKTSGALRASGAFTKIDVVMQPYDNQAQALTPLVLREQKANNAWWDGINRTVVLPTQTARVRLQVNYEGKGKIWLDNFKMSLPDPLFPQ